ncbi:hypothetical protein CROQUDRAFT_88637 [Cronartium quercuum f. sp. fusiforme G11]|uniref:Uncharacterized protein n=1 Tax=Cronartium quercuum f. sp. fusiforme G11 TaxID=708437 RepID=A0A9P6TEW5_9BASI|nr:hypothetical protein CROQUDRAFT_88637 [Cronartium quercuum f. sp. fusiforme G11]
MQRPLRLSNASRSSSGSSGTFLSASDGTTFTTPSGQDSCHRSHQTTTVAQSEALPDGDPLDCLMNLQIRSAISSKRYANQRHNSQSSGNISCALPPTIKDPSLGLTPTPKVSLPIDMNSSRYALTMAAVMKAEDSRFNTSLSKKLECGGGQNSRVPFPLALEDNSQGSFDFEKKGHHKTPHRPHPESLREQCNLEKHREIKDPTCTLHGVSDPKMPLKWESTEDYEEPLATINYEKVPAVTKGLKPSRSMFSFHSFFGAGQQGSRSSNIS